METLTIPVTSRLLDSIHMAREEIVQTMRTDFACKMFQEGQFSLEQGAEFSGVDMYDFLDALSARAIPVINYPPEELAAEVAGYLEHDNSL